MTTLAIVKILDAGRLPTPRCPRRVRATKSKKLPSLLEYVGEIIVGALLFGLLDLYTIHAVAMPYYTGLITHRVSGALASLPWADFRLGNLAVVFHRLAIFKGAAVVWPVMLVLWIAYLLATLWLMLGGAEWAAPGRRRDILR